MFVFSKNLKVPRIYSTHNDKYQEYTNTLIRTLLIRLFSYSFVGCFMMSIELIKINNSKNSEFEFLIFKTKTNSYKTSTKQHIGIFHNTSLASYHLFPILALLRLNKAHIIDDFLVKHGIRILHHSPYSPYLTPYNFWLFSALKKELRDARYDTNEGIVWCFTNSQKNKRRIIL